MTGGLEEVGDRVIDPRAVRQQRLEDAQLRLLATAVGDHPLPLEQLIRLERLRDQLRTSGPEPAA